MKTILILSLLIIGVYSQASTIVLQTSIEKIRPTSIYPNTSPLYLYAAKNEYESFQIALNGPLDVTGVTVDGLFNGFPAVVYREVYLDVTKASDCLGSTGQWPDALIPDIDEFYKEKRNAFPISVPAGQNRAVWVDFFVPPSAGAGSYTVHVNVMLSNGNNLTKSLSLEVFNFALPSAGDYTTEYGFSIDAALKAHGMDWSQALVLGQAYVDLALMHRVTLGSSTAADLTLNTRDKINWEQFTTNWQSFFQGRQLPYGLNGAKLSCVQILTPFCYNFSSCGSTDVTNQVNYWKEVVQYFKSKGWFDLLFDYTQDEPLDQPDRWYNLENRAKYVHEVDPNLRVLCTTDMMDVVNHHDQNLIDIWVPIINYMDPKTGCWLKNGNTRSEYNNVKNLWWYQSCMSHGCGGGSCDKCVTGWPDYMADHSAITNRIMSWMSYQYNISGELYWSINYASSVSDPWNQIYFAGGNGDGTLTYPGTPSKIGGSKHIPISSIRFKQIRDGIEDLLYMKMLEEKVGRDKVLSYLKPIVTDDYTFTQNTTLFYETRRDIGNQV